MWQSRVFSVAGRVHRMFRLQKTFTSDEVPLLYREPGVASGYRRSHQSTLYYIASAFQVNNETINIWTHVIGFLFIVYRLCHFVNEFGLSDERVWPLLGLCLCCVLYTVLSVCAHVIHSKSALAHYTCFQLDYAGIGLYAFGGALPVFCIGADAKTRLRFETIFLPVNLFLSWFCFFCCCIAKLRYLRPYPFRRKLWQVIPFGIHGILNISMLVPRALRCHYDNCDDPALAIYKSIPILVALTAVTFSCHLPEKLWPGVFDFIGQGHHVFHVMSIVQTLRQFDAAYEDALLQGPATDAADAVAHIYTILSLIMALCGFCVLTIWALRPYVLRRIKEDELLDKMK